VISIWKLKLEEKMIDIKNQGVEIEKKRNLDLAHSHREVLR
jgi:hypothetical protein